MARSKRKTIEQRVVGVAAMGMPKPVRGVVTSRWGSRLFLVLVVVLFSAGIVTVQWTNGRPQLQVDRERAQEVKQNLAEKFSDFEGLNADKASGFNWLSSGEQPAETGPIRGFFGQEAAPQDSKDASVFPHLGSTQETAPRFRDTFSSPKNSQPAEQNKTPPWFR